MAYSNQRSPRISNDRFGRPYQLKFATSVFNKKHGEILDDIHRAYFDLGGKTYIVETCPAKKKKMTKYGERSGIWIKVTKVEQRQRATSM